MLRVHDRHRGVEERFAQSETFDLDAQPLALLCLDGVVADVLVEDHAVDCGIQLDFLRFGEVIVGLDFVDFLQRPDAEGHQIADSRGRLQPQGMGPQ